MKILLVTDFLKPQTHGIAIRFEHYLKNFKEKNHNVTVYGPNNSLSSDKHLFTFVNPGNKDNRICLPTFQLLYDIIYNKYDVIHCVYPPSVSGLLILLLSLVLPLNVVTSNHVNMNYYGKAYNIYFTFYLVKYLIYAPQFYLSKLIMSPSVLEDLQILYDYKTIDIPTGIDNELFKFSDQKRENILLYVGRLAPEKNIDKLIKKFKSIENYKLWIIGFGPSEKKLKELAKYNPNIEFLGKKDNSELPYYYQMAKAHITLSESETFGLTLLESLSCGTPIIYPDCEVFNSLYEKDFGELCLTTNNTLENIINYIENNDLQLKCKEYAEQHSWSKATDQLIELYEKIN
jgi:glycosyltransferase involved in cell wall biosynthesis